MSDLFSKLNEARQKIEEAKKKLNYIVVEVEALNGDVKVKANANKVITGIDISENFLKSMPKTVVEKTVMNTINKALEEAAQKGETEMKEITKGMLPNFPGLI